MLTSIYVKDFILFDSLSLSFTNHMSAFIGETGAGKSLLIDAISMLMGERANASYVKQGKKQALIEGVFEIDEQTFVYNKLLEDGYDLDENLLVINRTISVDGKSVARINQRQTTIAYLREITAHLLDIHSQHDTQYLLNSKYHLSLLDQYGVDASIRDLVNRLYHEYKQAKDTLEDALLHEYNEDDLEFLQFQLQEIQDANLVVEEIEELEAKQKEMMAYEKIHEHVGNAIHYLDGSNAAGEQLYSACKELDGLRDFEAISKQVDALYDSYYTLDEQIQELKRYASIQDFDEAEFQSVQERLFYIRKIIRKYGGTIQSVFDKENELTLRIEQITHKQAYLEKQEQVVKEAFDYYQKEASKLSLARKSTAKALETAIMSELQDLHLPNAQFVVSFEDTISADGIDKVTFLIAMNRGTALKPLQQVASGGELSRLMLGLKTIFTKLQGIDSVIFDEIDTGVSGSVALAIGKKMQKLSKHAQVFCVTHLAQVAACAKNQYLVEKQQDVTTSTTIRHLENDELIQQLAFIATGSTSASSIAAAKELYQSAQNN